MPKARKAEYGNWVSRELLRKAAVLRMGAREVRFVDTSRTPYVRGAPKLPFMIGTPGLIYGIKG